MPYNLLSEPIRRYIRDKRWEELRPIQAAAIKRIIPGQGNFILASRTASGKTEAAFLPILSKLDFRENGIQVIYLSPLIALINDQFLRIEDLCKYLDVTITKWHGEASKAAKDAIIREPKGILLITPESIEAMFVNKPYNIPHLFSNLKYVVIDEIHSFIGTDRGTQLKSLLARIKATISSNFGIIGLSATIGDYNEAKIFTGDEMNTTVLLDKTRKNIHAHFRYFESDTEELPLSLLKNLYTETKDNKVLIFPNSRGRAEEVAVKLKKISEKVRGHSNYFSHHSSVDKEVREFVEHFAKNNTRSNFCISCTSTLELGIDIGSVDEVVQIDAAHSIASLIQRVGRSGRKEGTDSNLFLYATNQWSLLQSIACWTLYLDEFIEPPDVTEKQYDILLHQLLSILKGSSGITLQELTDKLTTNFSFKHITVQEINEIISYLLSIEFVEKLGPELILGVEGEKIVNSKDFYTVFKSDPNLKVLSAGNKIGEIPYSPQILENENILLAAKVWKIKYVDLDAKKIEVVPAKDGRKPVFSGGTPSVHPKIRKKMLEIIYIDLQYPFLDEASDICLQEIKKEFSMFKILQTDYERPILISEGKLRLYTFSGTKINHAIEFLLLSNGVDCMLDERTSSVELNVSPDEFLKRWPNFTIPLDELDIQIEVFLSKRPTLLEFSKWGSYLPLKYRIALLRQRYFDFQGATEFLQSIKLIKNTE